MGIATQTPTEVLRKMRRHDSMSRAAWSFVVVIVVSAGERGAVEMSVLLSDMVWCRLNGRRFVQVFGVWCISVQPSATADFRWQKMSRWKGRC